jgi:hypothetical protein
MAVALAIFGVAFAALCVWLGVRIVNRRERWAKWTLAAVIVLPTLYLLSVGPIVWLYGGEQNVPEWILIVYWPLRLIPSGPEFINKAFSWYLSLWEDPPAIPPSYYDLSQ